MNKITLNSFYGMIITEPLINKRKQDVHKYLVVSEKMIEDSNIIYCDTDSIIEREVKND